MAFAMLKAVWTALKSFVTRILHCAAADRAATKIACRGESCTTANRIKGKLRDIVPSPRGKATFSPELSKTADSKTANRSQDWLGNWAAHAVSNAAHSNINDTSPLARNGTGDSHLLVCTEMLRASWVLTLRRL